MKRVWKLFNQQGTPGEPDQELLRELRREVHQSLESIGEDYETFEFNTIISTLMELLNVLYDARKEGAVGSDAWDEALDYYVRMMAPAVPHIAEELWTEVLGNSYSVHSQSWPDVDPQAVVQEEFTLIVQVNGKLRDRVQAPVGISDQKAEEIALECDGVQSHIEGKEIKKVIVVPGRLVNLVV